MPSFVCDHCQETLKKAKLDQHAQRCRQAAFSCIDCYKTFKGVEYREHFSCITEVQKYHQKTPVTAKVSSDAKITKVAEVKVTKVADSTPAPKDSELTAAIKEILKSSSTTTTTADFKVVKRQLKKKLGKKAKKSLQEKLVFSLNMDTNELVIKLHQ